MCKDMNILRKYLCLLVIIIVCSEYSAANNVSIKGEVKVQALDDTTALITFPLTWENSWRGENWDAVWIFVKYKRIGVNEPWHHLYPKETGARVGGAANIPPMEFMPMLVGNSLDTIKYFGNQSPLEKEEGQCAVGMFMFRKTQESLGGRIDIPRVSLEWDIDQGDLSLYYDVTIDDIRQDRLEFSVQAIEMVYVPVGPFYAGDRTSPFSFVNESVTQPYKVETDNQQTIYAKGRDVASIPDKTFSIPDKYPMGYTGFYTMKYEVSQEQYTNFLNRIALSDQKKRIGRNWEELNEGEYVFGEYGSPSDPLYRNGIILTEKYTQVDTPSVFGFNLLPDKSYNSFNDGKDIACNYLSPEDMLAYLDWIGLRPHSELEYEKSARKRDVSTFPEDYSLAWGAMLPRNPMDYFEDVENEGQDNEFIRNNKNVNGGGGVSIAFKAPVRVGAFADATSTMEEAGASCWGIMELSGNLAEICYNVEDVAASAFSEDGLGDGNLMSTVIGWKDTVIVIRGLGPPGIGRGDATFDTIIGYPLLKTKLGGVMRASIQHIIPASICMHIRSIRAGVPSRVVAEMYSYNFRIKWPTLGWPCVQEAFGLRGGSFESEPNDYSMAVSNRNDANYYEKEGKLTSFRSKSVSFRGGASIPMGSLVTGSIGGRNNRTRDTFIFVTPFDLSDVNTYYNIDELQAGDDDPISTQFTWEMSDDGGLTWKNVEEIKPSSSTCNPNARDLVIDWPLNTGKVWAEYTFKRKSLASHSLGYGNKFVLCVPGIKIPTERLVIGNFSDGVTLDIEVGSQATIIDIRLTERGVVDPPIIRPSSITFPADIAANTNTGVEIQRSLFSTLGFYDIEVEIHMGGCTFIKHRELLLEPSGFSPCSGGDPLPPHLGITYAVVGLPRDGVIAAPSCWLSVDLGMTQSTPPVEYTYNKVLAGGMCPPGFRVPYVSEWNRVFLGYGSIDPGLIEDSPYENFKRDFWDAQFSATPPVPPDMLDARWAAIMDLDGVEAGLNGLGWLGVGKGQVCGVGFDLTYGTYFTLHATDPGSGLYRVRCIRIED